MNGLSAYAWLIVGLLICALLIVVRLLRTKADDPPKLGNDPLDYAFFGPFWLRRSLTRPEKIGWAIVVLLIVAGVIVNRIS